MLRARRLLGLLMVLGLGIGCGDDGGGTYVVVEIQRGIVPASTAVRSLRVELDLGGQPFEHTFTPTSGDITLPTRVGFLIRMGAGVLAVRVTARDGADAALAMGTKTVTVERGVTTTVAVALDTAVTAPAHLRIDRPSHDFGDALVSTVSSPVSFIIDNDGGQPTGALALTLGGADPGSFDLSASACQGTTLAAGASCTVTISFMPGNAGARTASLTVSGAPGGTVVSNLSGRGALPGSLGVLPASHPFGNAATGTQSAAQTFTVRNNGGVATSTVMVALTGSDLGQFSLGSDGCSGAPLAAAASCDIVVRFAPSSQGSFAASLSVSATDGGTAIASLTGTGVLPAILNVAPGMFTFPPTFVGEAATTTFNVDNTGGVDSGTVSVVLADTVNYSLSTNTCTGVLAPAGVCAFTVRFAPTAAGARNSMVTVSATPGGSRQIGLEGTGNDPLGWTGNPTFAGTLPAASTENVFVLRNSGSAVSGTLAITVSGANAGDFVRQGPGAGECIDGAMLAAGASCSVRVRFSASAPGARTAVLQASASPGGMPALTLNGTGLRGATLDGSPGPTYMFSSPQGVGTTSTARAWTVTNSGDENTGAMTITTGGDIADFPFTTTCNSGSVIAAHSSCGFDISFRPTAIGTRTATFQVSAGPGGTAMLTISGTGQPTLSVSVVGGGTGLVTSSPAGISCPPTCAAGFPLNATVQLRARTSNGSNAFFRSWGAGDCSGSFQDCNLTMSASRSATAQIATITHNLAFVSSTALAANLGGVAAYDAQCNALASAAGINNFDAPGGSAYVAWMSDSVTNAASRLASARGFVRRDGVPFGDDQSSLLSQARVFGVLSLDETGRDAGNREVMTGTDNFGSAVAGGTCSNWASNSVAQNATLGASHGGPLAWSQNGSGTCDIARPIYCLMRNRNAVVNPPTLTGTRRVWVSSGYTPGVTTPDAHCDGDRPMGVTSARALIATTTEPASSVVSSAITYVRPDGHVVGTGAQLASEATLQSGIWQTSSGSYFATGGQTWTGYEGPPGVLATLANSCDNWTRANTGIGRRGNLRVVSSWFQSDPSAPCDAAGATVRLYCVEQ